MSINAVNNHQTYRETLSEVINKETIGLSISTASVIRFSANALKELVGISRETYLLGSLRLATIGFIPIAIHDMAVSIFGSIKGTVNEKMDAALTTIEGIGTIGAVTSTFANGLECVGAVVASAITWATPLLIVGASFELAGIVLKVKHIAETYRFSKQFSKETDLDKKPEEFTIENYRRGLDMILSQGFDERSFINKHFQCDKEKLVDSLVKIESIAQEKMSSEDPQKVKEAQELLHETMTVLKKRMSSKNFSLGLKISASVVSVVGLALLVFAPITPAPFVLLAAGGGASIGLHISDKVRTKRFEQMLETTVKNAENS